MESIALLQRYMREPPSPPELFSSPYEQISGNRVLGDWVAAQLLDSALFRSIAACDRLAILLWLRAGRSLGATKGGRLRHPSFTRGYLDVLAADYGARSEWDELRKLSENERFAISKELRDGFTHSRRFASELHGEQVVSYAGGSPMRALDAGDHQALALAFYNVILRPAVELVGGLLEAAPSAPSTP